MFCGGADLQVIVDFDAHPVVILDASSLQADPANIGFAAGGHQQGLSLYHLVGSICVQAQRRVGEREGGWGVFFVCSLPRSMCTVIFPNGCPSAGGSCVTLTKVTLFLITRPSLNTLRQHAHHTHTCHVCVPEFRSLLTAQVPSARRLQHLRLPSAAPFRLC